jgi:UDP-sulfoquinovose synthase
MNATGEGSDPVRILVVGGDGYLGWPTAMYFSARGHDVAVLDNFTRRQCHTEQGSDSLTPVVSLFERVSAWRQVSGRGLDVHVVDVCDHSKLAAVVASFAPDTIVHYGELPSAPWSMADRDRAVGTQVNNIVGTLNILWAMRDHAPAAHLIKLGTMGEYGTPNIDIEEGYITIEHNGRQDTLPFPKQPGSFYHLSKVHDSHNIQFACRVWDLRATDLNQGVVYGIHTDETQCDDRLLTRFDYDESFGTALNRFCVQAVLGHPLTVYGRGLQRRGFLNIRDTMRCVELAAMNPAVPGEMRVFNQLTEVFSLGELATTVQQAGRSVGYNVELQQIDNPRVEAEDHYYNPAHTKLRDLGLVPTLLSEELVGTMLQEVERFKDRILEGHLDPRIRWR